MTLFDEHSVQLRAALSAVKEATPPRMTAFNAVKHAGMRVPQLHSVLTSKI
jgi:hypothetical protein